MARPIKETPILFGEDARRFKVRMLHPPKETAQQKKIRLKHYHMMLEAFEAGEKERKDGDLPSCILKATGRKLE